MSKIGNRIKELRKSIELTQQELGDKINLSKGNISKYENGSVEPNIETIELLSQIFDVTVDYLLGITDQKYFAQDETLAFSTTKDELSDEDLKMVRDLIDRLKEKHKK